MPRFKDDDFSERRNTADKAKKAMVESFRARPSSDDPATAKRNAARLALSEARDSRVKAREEAVKKREEDEEPEKKPIAQRASDPGSASSISITGMSDTIG